MFRSFMTGAGPAMHTNLNTETHSCSAQHSQSRQPHHTHRQNRRRCVRLHASGRSNDSWFSVTVRDVRLQLGSGSSVRQILNGIDLKIKRGSLHMLLGPNGCGKSTLLKVLGGLLPDYSGLIDSDGPSGFVFQNPDHQVVMPTVAADVAFGLGRYTLPEAEVATAVAASLKLVNMQDFMRSPTHTLSGGQRQRVAIAGALAEDPKVLLLDELTTFLDVEDQFGVLSAVRSITHQKQDVTALWVTHRFEELEYADAASYMDNGRVVYTGDPTQMRAYLKKLGAPVPPLSAASLL